MRIAAGTMVLLAAALGGCATTYEIRPATGGKAASQRSLGIELTADANSWDGQPYDLPNYMTPIAVRIINRSGQDLRVSYADFGLINEQGFRYSAVNPYLGTVREPAIGRVPVREPDSPMLARAGSEAQPELVGDGPVRGRVIIEDGQRVVAAAPAYGGERGSLVMAPGRRFFVYPRSHRVFRYYDPWPYGFSEPPYQGPYVSSWNQTYYPGSPSQDVLRLGLPEGVIRPGGQISGFLYFQNAGQRSSRLRLSWAARTPQGQSVAMLEIPFVIVAE